MPRRKAAPKPKSSALAQQRAAKAAQRAAQVALAPALAQLERLTAQVVGEQTHRLKDIAATLKALSEQPTEYAVILPRAERAVVAHNLSAARSKSPAQVKAGRAIQMGIDTYQDYLELPTRYAYSPEAERLLSILTGKWRSAYRSAECNADTGQHAKECAHLERRLVVSKRSLARELHGSAGGSQIALVSKCLKELAAARHTYSKAKTAANSNEVQILSSPEGEPILTYLRAGTGDTLESAAAARSLTLVLGEQYHAQLMQGFYRVERTERLTCWRESWQLDLMLRLISTPTTRYGSRVMQKSRDGQSVKLLLGRTDNTTELGSVGSLLEGSRSVDKPDTTTKRLEKFAEQLRAISQPDELQIVLIEPKRAGRRVVGWYLAAAYPEQPLTAPQAQRLAAEARRRIKRGEPLTTAHEAALRKVNRYPRREQQVLAALSVLNSGTKRTQARHEVSQLTHEKAPRLVLDSYIDTTSAKHETESERAARITDLRARWHEQSALVRRALKRAYPELVDLPS